MYVCVFLLLLNLGIMENEKSCAKHYGSLESTTWKADVEKGKHKIFNYPSMVLEFKYAILLQKWERCKDQRKINVHFLSTSVILGVR